MGVIDILIPFGTRKKVFHDSTIFSRSGAYFRCTLFRPNMHTSTSSMQEMTIFLLFLLTNTRRDFRNLCVQPSHKTLRKGVTLFGDSIYVQHMPHGKYLEAAHGEYGQSLSGVY